LNYIERIVDDGTFPPSVRLIALQQLIHFSKSRSNYKTLRGIVDKDSRVTTLMIAAEIATKLGYVQKAKEYLERVLKNTLPGTPPQKEAINKLYQIGLIDTIFAIIHQPNCSPQTMKLAFDVLVSSQSDEILFRLIDNDQARLEWELRAAEALVDLGNEKVIFEYLLPLMRDSIQKPNARLSAAIIVTKKKAIEEASSVIAELIESSLIKEMERLSAVEKILKNGNKEIGIQLAENIASKNIWGKESRLKAIDLLTNASAYHSLLNIIKLQKGSPDVIIKASKIILDNKHSSDENHKLARLAIIESTTSPEASPTLQLEAAESLQIRGFFDEALNIVIRLLRLSSLSNKDQERAVGFLIKFNQLTHLIEVSRDVTSPNCLQLIAKGISQLGKPEISATICLNAIRKVALRFPHKGSAREKLDQSILEKLFDLLVNDRRFEELEKIAYSSWLDPIARLRAAEALIDIGHPESAIEVLRIIALDVDQEAELRATAATALSEINTEIDSAIEISIRLLGDLQVSPIVARHAVAILTKTAQLNEIETLLREPSISNKYRTIIAEALADADQIEISIKICKQIVYDDKSDMPSKREAIRVLKKIASQDEIRGIIKDDQLCGSIRYSVLCPINTANLDELAPLIFNIGISDTTTALEKFALGEFLKDNEQNIKAREILVPLIHKNKLSPSTYFSKKNVVPELDAVTILAELKEVDELFNALLDEVVNNDIKIKITQALLDLAPQQIKKILPDVVNDPTQDLLLRVKCAAILGKIAEEQMVNCIQFCQSVVMAQDVDHECIKAAFQSLVSLGALLQLEEVCGKLDVSPVIRLNAALLLIDHNCNVAGHISESVIDVARLDASIPFQNYIPSLSNLTPPRFQDSRYIAIWLLSQLKQWSILMSFATDEKGNPGLRSYSVDMLSTQDDIADHGDCLVNISMDKSISAESRLKLLNALIKSRMGEISQLIVGVVKELGIPSEK
jgi:tetratricopeptide (TPR) repeat protein